MVPSNSAARSLTRSDGAISRRPITGNLDGLQTSQRRALEKTFRRRVPPREVVSAALARHLAQVSDDIGRQVGVLLGRDGSVEHVIVGDTDKLMLPDIGRLRGGTGRFRGLRLVHTHVRGEPITEDDLNDLALLRLDMVAVVHVDDNGGPGEIEAAYLNPAELAADLSEDKPPQDPFVHVHARNVHELGLDFQRTIEALEEEFSRAASRTEGARKGAERALIIGIRPDDEHFRETIELARSAGVALVGAVRQKRRRPHPKTAVGSGKIQEIVLEAMRRDASVAIFDEDLKPAQARAFEDATGLKAIDRTQLILDIFAQRARSSGGKLQVELAQLHYSLPRLTEKDEGLSRLTGGIGGRGPGETVMEIGRRRIRDRIRRLEKQVDKLAKQRDLRRSRRRQQNVPVLSIVGYTNAGKSTLLNALTDSDIAVRDKLFMTLDPTSRRLRFPREREVVITDTVGFITELPPDLLQAFRATLEELQDADLLLHVVDASDRALDEKVEAVEALLVDLELGSIPILRVLNKVDLVADDQVEALARRWEAVPVSATEGTGLQALLEEAERRIEGDQEILTVPAYERSGPPEADRPDV